jgi:hypothetical protein
MRPKKMTVSNGLKSLERWRGAPRFAPDKRVIKHKVDGNKSERAPVNHRTIYHRPQAQRDNDPFTFGARFCSLRGFP